MIDRDLAAFLQEGLGIHVGTRNGSHEPNGARAIALRVEPDGVHLVVYVAEIAAARLMADLEANGQAAVSLARPVDERAVQLKGTFVAARRATDAERPAVMAQLDGFRGSLERIGIPRVATLSWNTWPAVAITLKTTAVFNQTPGPGTGAPLS
jgi:hypothetical protein